MVAAVHRDRLGPVLLLIHRPAAWRAAGAAAGGACAGAGVAAGGGAGAGVVAVAAERSPAGSTRAGDDDGVDLGAHATTTIVAASDANTSDLIG